MKDKEDIKHPAFGLIQISRVAAGGGVPLFGSSVKHGMYFALRIYHGLFNRVLSREWFFYDSNIPIIEIALSPIQFIEMIASMNMGVWSPCTIMSQNGVDTKRLTFDDIENETQKFQKDFEVDVQRVLGSLPELIQYVEKLRAQPRVKKAELDVLKEKLRMVQQDIESNMPFVQQSFDKKMERTKAEAQASIDAIFTDLIMRLGVQALQDMYGKQLMSADDVKPKLHE